MTDYSMVTFTHPRARSTRFCETCGRKIAKGESYTYGKGKYESAWTTWSNCEQCSWLAKHIVDVAGIDYQDLEDVPENQRELVFLAEGDPSVWFTEARIFAWLKRKWIRSAGTPVPVEALRDLVRHGVSA